MEWNVEFHRKSYTTGTQDQGETNMTITQDIQDRLAVGAALSPSKLNTWLQFWDAFNGRRRHEGKRTTWKACQHSPRVSGYVRLHEDAMSLGDSDAASRDAPPTIDGTDIRLLHTALALACRSIHHSRPHSKVQKSKAALVSMRFAGLRCPPPMRSEYGRWLE